jgi:ubiquinone/menaquinone biosynthesis C-methylase UbiE
VFNPKGPSIIELAQQAFSSTNDGYDLLAPKFDLTPFRTPDDLLDQIAPYLGAPGSAADGLDLCTGTGAAMRVLHPVCTTSTTGIDRSQGMLDVARTRTLSGPADVRWVQGDALDALPRDSVDVVTCFGAHGHILRPQQQPFADNIFAALRPGGRYVCLTADRPTPIHPAWWLARSFNAVMHARNAVRRPPFIMFYLLFTAKRATEVLTTAGFDVVIDRDVLSRPYRSLYVITARKPS